MQTCYFCFLLTPQKLNSICLLSLSPTGNGEFHSLPSEMAHPCRGRAHLHCWAWARVGAGLWARPAAPVAPTDRAALRRALHQAANGSGVQPLHSQRAEAFPKTSQSPLTSWSAPGFSYLWQKAQRGDWSQYQGSRPPPLLDLLDTRYCDITSANGSTEQREREHRAAQTSTVPAGTSPEGADLHLPDTERRSGQSPPSTSHGLVLGNV